MGTRERRTGYDALKAGRSRAMTPQRVHARLAAPGGAHAKK
jgi:hypothetical protein